MQRPKNLWTKTLATSALVALALLGTSRAEAAELSTSPLLAGGDIGMNFICIFTNLGTKPVDVTITMTGRDATSGPVMVTTSPGDTSQVLLSGSLSNDMRCTVSGKFNTTKARLSMQLVDASTHVTSVAVEGR